MSITQAFSTSFQKVNLLVHLWEHRQGTMSMIFNAWISGELIYVGVGKMPRRPASESGSIRVVRISAIETNKPALYALSLPAHFQ